MSVALNVFDLVFGNSYALLIDNRLRHFVLTYGARTPRSDHSTVKYICDESQCYRIRMTEDTNSISIRPRLT